MRQCAAPRRARLGCVGAEFFGDQRESRPRAASACSASIEHGNVAPWATSRVLRSREFVGMNDIRPRRGDPDIAWDVHARVHPELAAARLIVQCLLFGF